MTDTVLPQQSTKPVVEEDENPLYSNADYKPISSNWFTAKPFGFRFTPKSGEAKVMYLPIGPSNLLITTHFATNIIPTIYGTVEEHSPVRYFDIQIEGTTGMGPKFINPMKPTQAPVQLTGRTAFPIQSSLSALGFFAKTLATVNKAIDSVKSIASIFTGPSVEAGLQLNQTGYLAFHNLYRFFLKYKKDVSGTDGAKGAPTPTARAVDAKHPLVFFNYKDNNEYNVVIKTFTLRRDKENPMLYNYTISMRGYELKQIDTSDAVTAVANPKAILAALGLNGVESASYLGQAKNIASQAKSILGSVAGGVNQLGR